MANTDLSGPAAPSPRSRSRKIAKWGSSLFIAFLAFAPPGTMIVIFLLASSFLGASWVIVAAIGVLAIGATVFIWLRRRRSVDR